MKELKDLVAGDEVLVTGTFHRRIAKVDKVTYKRECEECRHWDEEKNGM